MKVLALPFFIVASSIIISNPANANHQLEANIGLTSNYLWRGVTQSDDNASLSAGIDYQNSNGFYAGTWLATVDFNDDTNIEYDIFGGYQLTNSNVTYDIGYIYYGYQGEDNVDFSEITFAADFGTFNIGLAVLSSSDFESDFTDSQYYQFNYPISLNRDITLTLHAGHTVFKENDNYTDLSLAIEKSGFNASLTHVTGNDSLEDTIFAIGYQTTFGI